jgi:hypothetical protein
VGLAETLAELIIAEELKRGGELTISRTDPFFLFRAARRRVERNTDGTFRPRNTHDPGVELRTHAKKRGEPRKA